MVRQVWEAEYGGKKVAAKTTECPQGFPKNEIAILKKAQGKYTVKLVAIEEATPKGETLVMQLCDGSLEDQVKAVSRSTNRGPGGGFRQSQFLNTMLQIAEGLADLHARGVCRRGGSGAGLAAGSA